MQKKQKPKNTTENKSKSIILVFLIATLLLIIPLLGNNFVNGWNWTLGDFIFAWIMFAFFGLAYVLVSRKMNNPAYKTAVGIAVITSFLLIWINAAVGIIGDGPVNILYPGVIILGVIGALIARFRPKGMFKTLFLMAVVQMLVPIIALFIWPAEVVWSPGIFRVFCLTVFFSALFVVSALLFRKAARIRN